MNNYLIVRLSSLGDIIHTLPAYSALRKKNPVKRISWVVENKGKQILELVPGIDKVITIRAKGYRITQMRFWQEILHLKHENCNVALDFQGLAKSGLITFLSRAQKRIGFHRKNLKEPIASFFYTDRLCKIPENIHVITKNIKLLSMLGIQEKTYEFPITIPDGITESVKMKLKKIGHAEEKRIIILNVGAAWETKMWYPEKWVELIQIIKRKQKDLFLLLLWGNEKEKKLAENISEKTAISISPFLSLKEVIALIKKASLVVSGDTFALQAACALSRPVVGLFGPTNPKRNGPFNPRDKVIFHELDCSYCYKRKCSSLECLKRITPEEVAFSSLQILKENA